MTDWAAKVLEGVDKYTDIHTTDDLPVVFLDEAVAAIAKLAEGDGLVERISEPHDPGDFVGDIFYGHPIKTTMGTHRWTGTEWVALPSEAEALAGLLAEARKEAAARIAALTAQNRELALDVLASSGQAQEAYAAQLAAEAERDYTHGTNEVLRAENQRIEAERDALRAKVARLEGALTEIDALDPEKGYIGACSENAIRGLVLRMGEIARAALTDGGTGGGAAPIRRSLINKENKP